jgi:RHS repeat-associated protein
VAESNGDYVTWTYDATDQLLSDLRSGANAYTNTYSYDAAGNRRTQNLGGSITTYSYNSCNHIIDALDAAGRTSYVFDSNGNQITTIPPMDGRTTTSWDYENLPTVYQLSSGGRVTATYNADASRVTKATAAGTTQFVWDGNSYLQEAAGSGATTCDYTNEPTAYGNVISQYRSSVASYLHFDGLGSTRQVTNSSAGVTDTLLYDAWGVEIDRSGSTTISLTFVGELGYYLDSELLQYFVRRRQYDPNIARWLTCDPLGFTDGLNLYLYVRNQPIFGVDPSGTDTAIGLSIRSSRLGGVEDCVSSFPQLYYYYFCERACKLVEGTALDNGGGGTVICRFGIGCACVFSIDYWTTTRQILKNPKGRCPGLDACLLSHEKKHLPSQRCPIGPDPDLPWPYITKPTVPGLKAHIEECTFRRETYYCLKSYLLSLKINANSFDNFYRCADFVEKYMKLVTLVDVNEDCGDIGIHIYPWQE